MSSLRVTQILADVAAAGVPSAELCGRLVRTCAAAVPVTGVGMVLMTVQGPAGTVAATDGPASRMEELQFTLGEGPCIDSSRTGRPVLVPDLQASGSGRWPAFTEGALAAGIRAIFALPLRVGAIRLGVLDLYRDEPGPLSDAQLTEALHHADAATAILLHLQELHVSDGLGPGVLPVVDERAEVHQATGVVAVHAGVGLPEALSMLRARAFVSGRSILAVAQDVLAGALTLNENGADDP